MIHTHMVYRHTQVEKAGSWLVLEKRRDKIIRWWHGRWQR